MKGLIFAAGIATTALGFIAYSRLEDPALLQGALTLGGGWIICGLFALRAPWHGIGGAGVLALLAAARSAPAVLELARGTEPATPFRLVALGIAAVVLVATVRSLQAERARRQRAEWEAADPGSQG